MTQGNTLSVSWRKAVRDEALSTNHFHFVTIKFVTIKYCFFSY